MAKLNQEKVHYIVIHCSATTAGMDIGVDEIRRWHTDPKENEDGSLRYMGRNYPNQSFLPEVLQSPRRRGNGWDDVGYHWVIKRDGQAQAGRNMDTVGAHVRGHNSASIGICLVGGLDAEKFPAPEFTAEQYETLVALLAFLEKVYPDAEVLGHRDLDSGKDCPCFDVRDFLAGVEMTEDV